MSAILHHRRRAFAAADPATPPLPLLWWNLDINNNYDNLGTVADTGWDLAEVGTVVTTTSSINGTNRTVADINGTGGYLEYNLSGTKTVAHPSTSEDLSICCWVYWESLGSTFGEIINHREGTSDRNYQMMIWNDNENADFWVFDDGNATPRLEAETDVADALTVSTWYHLCSTFDSSTGTAKFYIDGTLEKTVTDATVDTINTVASPFAIGVGAWAKSTASLEFIGLLGRVGVFEDVLTEAQIATIYADDGKTYSDIWT